MLTAARVRAGTRVGVPVIGRDPEKGYRARCGGKSAPNKKARPLLRARSPVPRAIRPDSHGTFIDKHTAFCCYLQGACGIVCEG